MCGKTHSLGSFPTTTIKKRGRGKKGGKRKESFSIPVVGTYLK
jgi:hypothetical protein